MRHKYATTALVLSRSPHGEANQLYTLLTQELGLIRVRAQGIRKPGAKLASAMQTLSETDVTLIKAKDGWRLAGAIASTMHYDALTRTQVERVARVGELLTRFVSGDTQDPRFFSILMGLVQALPILSDEEQDAAEILAVLRLLRVLGLDAGELPEGEGYSTDVLEPIMDGRKEYISRVNRGITASGL